jgi:hypothetical protein
MAGSGMHAYRINPAAAGFVVARAKPSSLPQYLRGFLPVAVLLWR